MKRKLPALFNLVEIAFEDMLKHLVLSPERLIDVLTLIYPDPADSPTLGINGEQFYLALKVLLAARKDLDAEKFDTLHRLIWKRCWLAEDWELINDTKHKSDGYVKALCRDTIVLQTAALCFKNSLFAPGTGLTPITPTTTLGAGCDRQDIAYRFHVDDLIDPILHDNGTQDAQLAAWIDKFRLEHFWGIIQEEAKIVVEEENRAVEVEDEEARELARTLAEKEGGRGVLVGGGEMVLHDDDEEEDDEGAAEQDGEDEEDQGPRDGEGEGDGDVEMS